MLHRGVAPRVPSQPRDSDRHDKRALLCHTLPKYAVMFVLGALAASTLSFMPRPRVTRECMKGSYCGDVIPPARAADPLPPPSRAGPAWGPASGIKPRPAAVSTRFAPARTDFVNGESESVAGGTQGGVAAPAVAACPSAPVAAAAGSAGDPTSPASKGHIDCGGGYDTAALATAALVHVAA
jgi:hypothetical protein